MERVLGSKVMMSESKKEFKIGEDITQGVGSGLLVNGPNRGVGQIEYYEIKDNGPNGGLDRLEGIGIVDNNCGLNGLLDRTGGPGLAEVGPQIFQAGPKDSSDAEQGMNKRTKNPNRRKTHAHASKTGKENMRGDTSKATEKNSRMEITCMEVEEENAGAKRKTRDPLEEITEIVEVRKRPKLETEVAMFGKLLATQMGSAAAAVQPRREQ